MKNSIKIAATVLLATGLAVGILFWLNRSYGEVSTDAYQVAQALCSCCLAKNEQRLELVDSLLTDADDKHPIEITPQERQWLEGMVAKAKQGDWQAAAAAARQMMEDQVKP